MKVAKIFNCQRCGFCCQGETTVSLDEDDQRRMVHCLGLSVEEVRDRYWRVTGTCVQMKTVNGHCIFYNEGCLVHSGRPWRCGQWPLHPSILQDVMNFHTIAESCPGINTTLGYEEFCTILREVMADEKKVCC
ncbi:MAG: YkgJ family cysteine cluster protein [Desulfoprunum sp.]|nr:YkgJ family cysteine cluster protein [Desulfoprunum sp.]